MENHYNCVYMYINKINNKKYVGQTTNFERRYKQRLNDTFNENKSDYYFPIHNAIRKYGIENFEILILKENLNSQCLMNLFECYYIEKYNTLSKDGCGYNIAEGGSNGFTLKGKTKEEIEYWKEKISKSHIGKTITEETKEKLRRCNAGEGNPFYGKQHSEESRRKMSESHKGLQTGKNNPNWGKKASKETLEKMSINRSRDEVVAIKKDDNTIYIKRNTVKMSEFLTELMGEKYFTSNIHRCCEYLHNEDLFYQKYKKRYKSYKGFIFYFKEDYLKLNVD